MEPDFPEKPPRMDWDTFDRFLAGDVNPHESKAVQAYLARHSGVEAHLRTPTTFLVDRDLTINQKPSWDALQARLSAATAIAADPISQDSSVQPEHRQKRRGISSAWASVTALCGVVIAVFAIHEFANRTTGSPQEVSAILTQRTYATQAGQHATVSLPDGSRALLGPETTLQTQETKQAFTAVVNGEALFTVTHHSARPFIVRTNQSITRVLGTTFGVRHYATDRTTRVVVTEGRVSVQSVRDSVAEETHGILTKNALAIVDDSGRVIVNPNISISDYMRWTQGELVFQSATVRDVIADLNRSFGSHIRLADSTLADVLIDWTVQTKRYPLSQVLPELLKMLNAHAKESGASIIIIPGRLSALRSAPLRPSIPEKLYGR